MSPNPMLKNLKVDNISDGLEQNRSLTLSGVINKSSILFLITVAVAAYSWYLCSSGFSDKAMLLTTISAIAGLILALITSFKPKSANITAPVYALCEGILVGSVSYAFNSLYNGIVIQAVSLTLLTFMAMLFLYKAKIIQATPKFKKIIFISTLSIAIFYLALFIGSFFGLHYGAFGTPLGIGISLFVCVIAALNYIVDFDVIEQSANNGLPECMEWYSGFSLLVTTVWLYFELLRLLAQFYSKRD